MMIYDRLFKTVPSLLPRDYLSLDDYSSEEMSFDREDELSKEGEQEDDEEIYWA